mmetsp:Transcript_10744/g.18082  ORF Transcript_10744/g.18082 Transcript_10744/m.18082 type:complete len:230 (+) Transcript_10744:73-762(+)
MEDSTAASSSSSGAPVFEIREYLNADGSVSSHDVIDISKEMEMMSRLCGSTKNPDDKEANYNEDEQFIRDLALLSEANKYGDSLLEEDEAGQAIASPIQTTTTADETTTIPVDDNNQSLLTAAAVNSTKTVNKDAANRGWKKGFLQPKAKTKIKLPQTSAQKEVNGQQRQPQQGTHHTISPGTPPTSTGVYEQESKKTLTQPAKEELTSPFSGNVFERLPPKCKPRPLS